MTYRSNDDIANALGKLAGGEHVEPSEHVPSGQANVFPSPAAPTVPPPAAPARPAPAPPGPVIHRPTGTPSARPRPQPRVNAPPAAAPTAVPPATARQGRPSQPVPSAPPPPRPVAPATPSPTYQPPAAPAAATSSSYITDDGETTGIQPVDEDDAVIVPAAPLSALGFRPHAGPSASVTAARALDRRRTIIPLLLTAGLLLLATAVLRFVAHPDSPLAGLPAWIPVVLVLVAAVILGVAGLNMAQVRQHLRNTPATGTGR